MLYTNTVEPGALALLKKLMSVPELSDFSLVGGTALALRYGHRISIDLDLFSSLDFDCNDIADILTRNFSGFLLHSTNKIGVFGHIDGIKVDFVKYHYYPIIGKIVVEDNIRMLSDSDLIAMKVNAILRRAVKKDFWDIAELMNHYSVEDIIDFYHQKYFSQRLLISIPRALTYFDDAEESDEPACLNGQTWSDIKEKIRDKINDYLM